MSEKRFEVIDDSFSKWIVDTTLKEDKHEGAIYTAYDMCRKLNELFEENEQLREINKELGDDLYNCRLNKNIIREKLKLWQDVHKEYGIYSIKDFEESFELDAKINKEKGI